MKTIGPIIIGAAVLFFVSAIPSLAIEGLQVSVQSSNAVLSWPSASNETYLAQYRPTLNATDSWATLTDYLAAATGTNLTFFIHSNVVQYPPVDWNGGTNGGGAPPMPGGTNTPSGGTNTWATSAGFYRVVRDGVHVFGLTNGLVVSGEVQLPIEFAVSNTDQIVGVTFYDENNSPIIGASATGSGNQWTLDWNTPMSFNGDYNIYAEIDFASDDPAVSVPVAVTVSNVISFPNYFSRVFGSQMWIYAQTIPDAAYEIDLYDENTNYLGSFLDYADDSGLISFLWDLTDGEGNTFESTNFYGVFTVDTSSLPAVSSRMRVKGMAAKSPDFQKLVMAKNRIRPARGGSSAGANQLWVKEPEWTPNNNWVVTYGLFSGQDGQPSQDDVYMIVGGAGAPTEYYGVLGTLDPYGLNQNLSPGNNAQNGNVFTLDDSTSRSNLLSYLASSRYENFYFFGHGNNSAIGSYNGFTVTRDQIAYALGNVPLSDSIIHAALHPYRFVFIDACDTGAGNFCEAFGIPAQTLSTNNFAAEGLESRVFVGFKHWKINLNFVAWENYSAMTHGFLQAWLDNVDINTIVQNAKNNGFNTGAYLDSSVVIYGAQDLQSLTRTRP